jgi:serine/threonine-protein kinase
MTLLGHELAGRYRLDALIGAGGMATVYRAHDTRLDRDVAVKMLSTHLAADPVLAERFQREARALAAFTHPAIVAVYDVGEEGGDPFFVMELVEGETLADRLSRAGPLPPDEGVAILTSVAQGLGALHARGFIHRDVKPHNILLAAGPVPGAGARLADFGLVRGEAQRDLTAPGTAIGTMAYLAPEILAGEPATPAADVYALAAVAYEALTGRPPFPAETLPGLVAAQAEPVPPASVTAPWLGSAFDAPLAGALGPASERPDLGSFADSLAAAAGAWAAAGHLLPPGTVAPVEPRPIDTGAATAPVGTAARPPSARRAAPVWLFAAVAAVLGLALMVAFLGSLRPFEGTAGAAATSPPATDSPTPEPQTEPPVVEPVSDLQAAFDEFAAALQDAQGGRDGLRGKDANELEKLAAEIRRALDEGDGEKAVKRADELVRKVEKLRDDGLSGEAGDRLLSAAERLRQAVREATGLGGGDGDGDEGAD